MDTNPTKPNKPLESSINPIKPLPYDEGAFDTYHKYGYLMFPQQKQIYNNLKKVIGSYSTVLEVGCGIGLGTAMLSQSLTTKIIGTDNLIENVKMAKELYPWLRFEQYDICVPNVLTPDKFDVVVAVEVIEHVEDAPLAIKELCYHTLKHLYISTPNGKGKKRPPENPYHVCEYYPSEIFDMIPNRWEVDVLDWQTFNVLKEYNNDPLVYRLTRV